MAIVSPEIVAPAPAPIEVAPVQSEREVQTVTEAYQLVREYGADTLLRPLAEYFPDASEPLHAVLSVSHIYDYPVRDIVSVVVDAENSRNPLILGGEHFEPYVPQQGVEVGGWRQQTADGPVRVQFGQTEYRETLFDRPLPDDWKSTEHSAADWRRRAEIAEDITIYLAHGARQIMHDRSPANLFDAATLLKPFWDYGEDCTNVAKIIEAAGEHRAKEQRRHDDFLAILHEPVDFMDLWRDDFPFTQERLHADKVHIDRLVLSAWRTYSERTITPAEHQRLNAESAEAVREVQMMARYALKAVQYFADGVQFARQSSQAR